MKTGYPVLPVQVQGFVGVERGHGVFVMGVVSGSVGESDCASNVWQFAEESDCRALVEVTVFIGEVPNQQLGFSIPEASVTYCDVDFSIEEQLRITFDDAFDGLNIPGTRMEDDALPGWDGHFFMEHI